MPPVGSSFYYNKGLALSTTIYYKHHMARDAPLSFRITQPMRDAITRLAKEERRSFSQVVLILIEEALKARGIKLEDN